MYNSHVKTHYQPIFTLPLSMILLLFLLYITLRPSCFQETFESKTVTPHH